MFEFNSKWLSIYNNGRNKNLGVLNRRSGVSWFHCREIFQSSFRGDFFFFYVSNRKQLLKNIKQFQKKLPIRLEITSHKNIVVVYVDNFWKNWKLSLLTAILKDCVEHDFEKCFKEGKYLKNTKEAFDVVIKNKKNLKDIVEKRRWGNGSRTSCCWKDKMKGLSEEAAEKCIIKG